MRRSYNEEKISIMAFISITNFNSTCKLIKGIHASSTRILSFNMHAEILSDITRKIFFNYRFGKRYIVTWDVLRLIPLHSPNFIFWEISKSIPLYSEWSLSCDNITTIYMNVRDFFQINSKIDRKFAESCLKA